MEIRVGFVDDDEEFASMLAEELDRETLVSSDPRDALEWVEDDRIDCLISDLKMGSTSGLDLLEDVRSASVNVPVILMTGHGSIDTAVEAMKKGAVDYLEKPIDGPEIRAVVQRLSEDIRKDQRLEGFRESQRLEDNTRYRLVGDSEVMMALREKIDKIAPQPMSVLIKGETGTGKEIIARQVHAKSNRSDSPMMTVNCAAIPGNLLEEELFGHKKGAFTGADETKKGKLELADGGTVFLDEVGELPLDLQPKLLRVLEQGEVTKVGGEFPRSVDVRFLAATNRDMQTMMDEQTFRKDLYYRLNSLEITSPSLRDHLDDIPKLVEFFLDQLGGPEEEVPRFSGDALDVLKNYDWPGNVRELKNVVERSSVLATGEAVTVDDLPEEITGESRSVDTEGFGWTDYGENLPDALDALEMEVLADALEAADGNKAEAARRLGISRQSLQYKLKNQSDSE